MQDAPTCPFCQASWTQEMIVELERFSSSGGCSCCGGLTENTANPPLPVEQPDHDLCCASCGKAIYLAPLSGR